MDIASLASVMGHASRAMTLDTYGDADPDATRLAMGKLSIKFGNDSTIEQSEEVTKQLRELQEQIDKMEKKK